MAQDGANFLDRLVEFESDFIHHGDQVHVSLGAQLARDALRLILRMLGVERAIQGDADRPEPAFVQSLARFAGPATAARRTPVELNTPVTRGVVYHRCT